MIDVLYILGKGSVWNNYELRFSLRSLEQHARGIGRVFVVGEDPGFLSPRVVYHRFPDPTSNREYNIASKIAWACANTTLSPDFLFVNDDHILVADINAPEYPYYRGGSLEDALERATHEKYRKSIRNTIAYLKSRGATTHHYDIHVPIIYSREKFVSLADAWERSKRQPEGHGFIVKSIYGNLVGVTPGPRIADCKLTKPKPGGEVGRDWVAKRVSGRHVFSFSDAGVINGVCDFLKTRFPTPSKYEL